MADTATGTTTFPAVGAACVTASAAAGPPAFGFTHFHTSGTQNQIATTHNKASAAVFLGSAPRSLASFFVKVL